MYPRGKVEDGDSEERDRRSEGEGGGSERTEEDREERWRLVAEMPQSTLHVT